MKQVSQSDLRSSDHIQMAGEKWRSLRGLAIQNAPEAGRLGRKHKAASEVFADFAVLGADRKVEFAPLGGESGSRHSLKCPPRPLGQGELGGSMWARSQGQTLPIGPVPKKKDSKSPRWKSASGHRAKSATFEFNPNKKPFRLRPFS